MSEESVEKTLQERKSTYGTFEDNAYISQMIKELMHTRNTWHHLSDVQQEALGMIALKLSRILSEGDGHMHADNWHDIAGYAKLVENQIKCGRCNG